MQPNNSLERQGSLSKIPLLYYLNFVTTSARPLRINYALPKRSSLFAASYYKHSYQKNKPTRSSNANDILQLRARLGQEVVSNNPISQNTRLPIVPCMPRPRPHRDPPANDTLVSISI